MKRTWIRLFIDQTLRGTMIEELTPEQRWIFIGLILLAGESSVPGLVFGRKDEDGNHQGKPSAVLAYDLGVDESSIKPALEKMVAKGKVAIDSLGVISICNWDKYQSEYQRQKPYRNESYKDGDKAGDVADRDRDREGDREKEEEKSIVDQGPTSPSKSDLAKEIVQQWNRFAKGHELPTINGIARGSSRERALYMRLGEKGFDFEKLLEAIHAQPFLFGDNDRGWLVNFDWILKPANMTKILEGAYVREVRGRAKDRQPEDPRVGGRR